METKASYGSLGSVSNTDNSSEQKLKISRTRKISPPPFQPTSSVTPNACRRVRSHSDSVDRLLDQRNISGALPFRETIVKNEAQLPPQDISKSISIISPLIRDNLRNGSISDDDIHDQESLRMDKLRRKSSRSTSNNDISQSDAGNLIFNLIITIINTIMCVPCLYGYASVIFIHPAFSNHINALSKLVLFSSIIHQICFSIFSTLPFAIGQVQDAGLIFLSSMARKIANQILAESDGTEDLDEVIVSTTIALLGASTAALGIVLVLLGKFRLADAVSYIPMPVVGGYLAFIGYFCVEAGIALSISEPMIGFRGWSYLFNRKSLILAFPGIVASVALVWVSRNAKNEAMLPAIMSLFPILFYLVLYLADASVDDARNYGWIGQESPPISARDVFSLINVEKIRWDLIHSIVPTWAGMVFVVSFSSCLDVAAISMDMGEALETNTELVTVGISNVCSGLLCGFTGSYIFSQTIFTYRSGAKSRWIGVLLVLAELSVFFSTINILEIAPLFFLGAVLTFIGVDLMYEWLIEVSHKLVMSEYLVLMTTFIAIQVLGIDGGILFGIIVAVCDFVITTAQSSSLQRTYKRSRAVWGSSRRKVIENIGYNEKHPLILSLEIKGAIFFGSSLQLMTQISQAIGISNLNETDRENMVMLSPRHLPGNYSPKPGAPPVGSRSPHLRNSSQKLQLRSKPKTKPQYVVLDLSHVTFIDASAARGCFLQLSKMCASRDIMLCGSGASPRVDWMLRSHEVAYSDEEEANAKLITLPFDDPKLVKLLLFETVYDALEYCEVKLLDEMEKRHIHVKPKTSLCDSILPRNRNLQFTSLTKHSLPAVLAHFLGLEEKDMYQLDGFASVNFHKELELNKGEVVFTKGRRSDEFFIILSGSIGLVDPHKSISHAPKVSSPKILSGAGPVRYSKSSTVATVTNDVAAILRVGCIFGFVDFIMEQSRTFDALCTEDHTVLAVISRSGLQALKQRDPELDRIVTQLLLQASILELNNGTVP